MADTQLINLNIGGVRYRTTHSTLTSVPGSLLATYAEDGRKKIFIDRDGATFKYILNYLRVGADVILPEDLVMLKELRLESQFYQLHQLRRLVEKKIGCSEKQAQTSSRTSGGAKGYQQSNVDGVKVEQNGESRGDSDNNAAASGPICTNAVCVRKGKCGVLQHSDKHITDVWMCPECYCTIAIPQQQTEAEVNTGGPVSNNMGCGSDKTTVDDAQMIDPHQDTLPDQSKQQAVKTTKYAGRKPAKPNARKLPSASTNALYPCKLCPKIYTQPSKLQAHVRYKHTVSKHKCHTCLKCFTTARDLRLHVEIVHEGVKRHQCRVCSKTFGWRGDLSVHIKAIHEGERFKCDQCGKMLTEKRHLKEHMLIHQAVKPHVCHICGKVFSSYGSLSTHRRGHAQVTGDPSGLPH